MPLKIVGTIAITGATGSEFDHAAFDTKSRRVFIAHTARDCVEVIDHDAGRHLATLPGFPGVAGAVADDGQILVTNRGSASIALLDAGTPKTHAVFKTGARPNGAVIVARSSLAIAACIGDDKEAPTLQLFGRSTCRDGHAGVSPMQPQSGYSFASASPRWCWWRACPTSAWWRIGRSPHRAPTVSEKVLVSHYENNYVGAVKRLNAIGTQLAELDFAKAPNFVINGLKREELVASNSMILHEIYFDGLGGGAKAGGPLADAIARDFGSMERWRSEFAAMGNAEGGGSGWVILAYSPRDESLMIQTRHVRRAHSESQLAARDNKVVQILSAAQPRKATQLPARAQGNTHCAGRRAAVRRRRRTTDQASGPDVVALGGQLSAHEVAVRLAALYHLAAIRIECVVDDPLRRVLRVVVLEAQMPEAFGSGLRRRGEPEHELGVLVDELLDEPWAGDAIDLPTGSSLSIRNPAPPSEPPSERDQFHLIRLRSGQPTRPNVRSGPPFASIFRGPQSL